MEELPAKAAGNTKWTSFFKDNRKGGLSVPAFPKSEGPIILPQELYQCIKAKWGHCLIGYIAGRFPGHKAILDMCKSWGVKFTYHTHASGWLVFKFEHEECMDKVLAEGPYFVFQRPLLLKPMPECFNFGREEFNKVPVWVQVWGLPLNYWHPQALGRILSQIGTPLRTDELTLSKGASLNYARVLVEIDVTCPYQEELQLTNHLQMEFKVQLIYENKPKFCEFCKSVGHLEGVCRMKAQNSQPANVKTTNAPHQGSISGSIPSLSGDLVSKGDQLNAPQQISRIDPLPQGTSEVNGELPFAPLQVPSLQEASKTSKDSTDPDHEFPEKDVAVEVHNKPKGNIQTETNCAPALPGDPDLDGFSPAASRKLKKERAAAKKMTGAHGSLDQVSGFQNSKKHKGSSKNIKFVGGGALLPLPQ